VQTNKKEATMAGDSLLPALPVLAYLESHLGTPGREWRFQHDNGALYQVIQFVGQPVSGASTYASVGLSSRALLRDGVAMRQELLFACYDRFESWGPEKIVAVIARVLMSQGNALSQGELLGPAGPLFPDSTLEAMYCTTSATFTEPLVVPGLDVPISIIWLLPVTASEAEIVAADGVERFEGLLVQHDRDLLDLQRAGVA